MLSSLTRSFVVSCLVAWTGCDTHDSRAEVRACARPINAEALSGSSQSMSSQPEILANVCGDGVCDVYETESSCRQDCWCGDGVCRGETTATCPRDCGCPACNGTAGQWSGCRGNGCAVCTELVSLYPLYFTNHTSCSPNNTCAGQYYTCNANCPAPTSADACNGTAGQWSGCRGNGCAVCAELVQDYPCYFQNHPSCARNTTCDGQYYTCNEHCPAPTQADLCM